MNVKIKKIVVIIPHRGIGDVIFHLPLLKTLHKSYNKRIVIISNKSNKSKSILKEENFLEKIIYFNFNRTNIFNYILRFIKLREIIKNLNADILILTDPSKRLVIPIFFCKANKKVYLGIKSFGDFLFKKKFKEIPLANHLLNLIKSLELSSPEYSYILNNRWIKKKINYGQSLKKPYIFFNLDSHHNHNNWDISGFKKIIDKIKKSASVFINTSPNNLKFFKKDLKKYLNKSNIIITSKFSIIKLIKTISNCEIIIGNESGPICIGAALNKKVISIYSDKTSKPESGVISKNIKYFNTSKLNKIIIIQKIYKNIKKNWRRERDSNP